MCEFDLCVNPNYGWGANLEKKLFFVNSETLEVQISQKKRKNHDKF